MTPACPICSSTNSKLHRPDVEDFEYFVRPAQHYKVMLCNACSSEFLDPRPSEDDLPAFYPSDYHAYHNDHGTVARLLVDLRARSRARFYNGLLNGNAGKLFDIGVGDCRHFDALASYCPLTFAGVEIKEEMAVAARKRGYDVVHGTLESMDMTGREGQYDIVSMNHVVEHVIEPQVMIRRSFELLKPGGVVLGQLPTNTCWEEDVFGRCWAGYHFPRHLQAFSHKGLRDLLAASGFSDINVSSAAHVQSAISVQNALVARGWRPRMTYGKMPIYSLFMLGVLPFEFVAFLFNRGGIMNFMARKA